MPERTRLRITECLYSEKYSGSDVQEVLIRRRPGMAKSRDVQEVLIRRRPGMAKSRDVQDVLILRRPWMTYKDVLMSREAWMPGVTAGSSDVQDVLILRRPWMAGSSDVQDVLILRRPWMAGSSAGGMQGLIRHGFRLKSRSNDEKALNLSAVWARDQLFLVLNDIPLEISKETSD